MVINVLDKEKNERECRIGMWVVILNTVIRKELRKVKTEYKAEVGE